MPIRRFVPNAGRLLVAMLSVALAGTSGAAQSDASPCARLIRTIQGGSPRAEDFDLLADGCAHVATRVLAHAERVARNAAAERPARLAALRALVVGFRPDLSLSSQWLAEARPGDPLPRSAHGARTLAVEAGVRDAVRSALADLLNTEGDSVVRRASLVLLQGLIRADDSFASVEPGSVRLIAQCSDRVRLETTSEISVPYVVRVEGTTFDRTIWMKPAKASAPSQIELALPLGIVTVTVAGRAVARLEGRPGACPS